MSDNLDISPLKSEELLRMYTDELSGKDPVEFVEGPTVEIGDKCLPLSVKNYGMYENYLMGWRVNLEGMEKCTGNKFCTDGKRPYNYPMVIGNDGKDFSFLGSILFSDFICVKIKE